MHTSSSLARASLGALAAAAAFAAAPAAAQTNVFGGGATLPSLVLIDEFACYGLPASGTRLPAGCTARTNTLDRIQYTSVGSGAGRRGWLSNSAAQLIATGVSGGFASPTAVHYGVSEGALTSTNVNVYNNGGTSEGVTLAAQNVAPAPGQFPNGATTYGPAIQVPALGTPVTIAYDPVYKQIRATTGERASYRFNVRNRRADGSGGLDLSRQAWCGIFGGQITNWNDPILTALNNNTSLADPGDPDFATFSLPISVVVRGESSGTTSLFTRAIAAQCGTDAPGLVAAIGAAGQTGTFPGVGAVAGLGINPYECRTVADPAYALGAATYIAAQGSEGVATCLDSPKIKQKGSTLLNGRIGYVSPDFVLPAVNVRPFSNYALNTADVANQLGQFVAPTPAATQTALGAFPVPATTADRANPLAWVSPASGLGGNPVANPNISGAYPIVGTSNFLFYTCYASSPVQNVLARTTPAPIGFINWYYGNAQANTILSLNGFTPVPAAMASAIINTFANSANTTDNLFIRTALASGIGPNGVNCSTGAN